MEIDIIDSSYGASPHSPHIQTADAHQTTTLSSILGKRSADDLLFPRKETWKKHAKVSHYYSFIIAQPNYYA